MGTKTAVPDAPSRISGSPNSLSKTEDRPRARDSTVVCILSVREGAICDKRSTDSSVSSRHVGDRPAVQDAMPGATRQNHITALAVSGLRSKLNLMRNDFANVGVPGDLKLGEAKLTQVEI